MQDITHLIVAGLAFLAGTFFVRRLGPEPEVRRSSIPAVPGRRGSLALPADPEPLSAVERIFGILFAAGWLVGWRVAIVMVFGLFQVWTGGVALFLGGWLIAALAGWGAAVVSLTGLIRNRRPRFWRRC